jgi:hypothetical protein
LLGKYVDKLATPICYDEQPICISDLQITRQAQVNKI